MSNLRRGTAGPVRETSKRDYGTDVTTRYRCNACGNLTRFDVVETTTRRAFHHYTVGGELEIEEDEIITHSTDSVACRWCGHGRDVEALD